MNNSEIEQFTQAMNNLTTGELDTLAATVGHGLVAKMQAAVAQRDAVIEHAAEEIVHGAEIHLRANT